MIYRIVFLIPAIFYISATSVKSQVDLSLKGGISLNEENIIGNEPLRIDLGDSINTYFDSFRNTVIKAHAALNAAVWDDKVNVGIEISHSSIGYNNLVGHYDRNPAFGSLDKSNAFGVKSIDPKLYVDFLIFDPVSVTLGLTYAWNVSFWSHSKSNLEEMGKKWEYPEVVPVMSKISKIAKNGYSKYFVGLSVDIWKLQLSGRFSRNIGDMLNPFHYKGKKYTFNVNNLNYSLVLMYKYDL